MSEKKQGLTYLIGYERMKEVYEEMNRIELRVKSLPLIKVEMDKEMTKQFNESKIYQGALKDVSKIIKKEDPTAKDFIIKLLRYRGSSKSYALIATYNI